MKHTPTPTFLAAMSIAVLGTLLSSGQASAGVVAAWTFDNDFSADAGGAAFDLTAVNSASSGGVPGRFGNAASFARAPTGARNQYAFTGGDVLTAGSDFSHSAWYRLEVTNITGSNRYFVLETTAGDAPSGTQAWTASLGLRDTGGDIMQVSTYPSQSVFNIAGGNATDGGGNPMWHNILVTWDNDGGTNAGDGRFTGYLDGTSIGALDRVAPLTAVGGLVIGGHRSGTGRNFEGLIDDVIFYDHVLGQSEVDALQITSGIPEPSMPALLGVVCAGLFLRRRRG